MTTAPDLINGLFAAFGGIFIYISIVKLHRERQVRGVSWAHAAFFAVWGLWNLFYYPHLEQWASFFGGAVLVTANLIWLGQIVYWNWMNRPRPVSVVTIVEYDDRMEADQFGGGFDRTPRYRHEDK